MESAGTYKFYCLYIFLECVCPSYGRNVLTSILITMFDLLIV